MGGGALHHNPRINNRWSRSALDLAILALGLALFFGLHACLGPGRQEPAATVMTWIDPGRRPELGDDLDAESLQRALNHSRAYYAGLPSDTVFKFGPDEYSAAHLLTSLEVFERLFLCLGPGPKLDQALSRDFIFYQCLGRDDKGKVLITGYYEPLLSGSRVRTDRCQWPVYRRPPDLIQVELGYFNAELSGRRLVGRASGGRLEPYYTRRDIDRLGVLEGRGLELVWVDDPIDLFFLHVQGSGRVQLPDGECLRVGFDVSNGRVYRSPLDPMIKDGVMSVEEASLQSIKAWLKANPARSRAYLEHNERYVFFKPLAGDPMGNLGRPLTPHRSVALDHRLFPKGALAWLRGRTPVVVGEAISGWRDFGRFVLVQDTGAAITGPGRLDLFFGPGPAAEASAGRLKEPGRLYFLVKRPGPAERAP
ncbi:MAG: MltA domain-containing protein [Thermodesulfobacteriota bacterium]